MHKVRLCKLTGMSYFNTPQIVTITDFIPGLGIGLLPSLAFSGFNQKLPACKGFRYLDHSSIQDPNYPVK